MRINALIELTSIFVFCCCLSFLHLCVITKCQWPWWFWPAGNCVMSFRLTDCIASSIAYHQEEWIPIQMRRTLLYAGDCQIMLSRLTGYELKPTGSHKLSFISYSMMYVGLFCSYSVLHTRTHTFIVRAPLSGPTRVVCTFSTTRSTVWSTTLCGEHLMIFNAQPLAQITTATATMMRWGVIIYSSVWVSIHISTWGVVRDNLQRQLVE